jgi:hypothetical protein
MGNKLIVLDQEKDMFLLGWYSEFLKDLDSGGGRVVIQDLYKNCGMSLEGLLK